MNSLIPAMPIILRTSTSTMALASGVGGLAPAARNAASDEKTGLNGAFPIMRTPAGKELPLVWRLQTTAFTAKPREAAGFLHPHCDAHNRPVRLMTFNSNDFDANQSSKQIKAGARRRLPSRGTWMQVRGGWNPFRIRGFLSPFVLKMVANVSDAEKLRNRAKRLLELATRARCEGRSDYAMLLMQVVSEIFEHAREMERRHASKDIGSVGNPQGPSTQDAA
jgi:hypothetical protein